MQRKTDKTGPSEKILNTAFECLSTRGYAAVTMRNIADEAGVALGQVTYYYKSKENLFLEVINMMIYQYLSEIERKLESATGRKQKFAALMAFFKELLKDNPNLFKLFIDFTAQALWVPSFREKVNSLFERLAEIIEKNLTLNTDNDNRKSDYSPRNVAKLILGAFYGTSIQLMLSSDNDVSFESLNLAESLIN
ncbi:MAG TPA: TetR/AcrR family transcriptional regulator [Clostridia bacterium]|jgi:AcrR family transcriptional regulator|nr:TetR/AcrR family transcriptional regulator [Candidatus Pelethousia sp.]HOD93613.1 TetR/AcrR family transcriptional regulator [Clostridia bacterium]HQM40057.1 TetR/AcrR family transcriptional regulator [Clostridia bacterium]